MFNQNRIYRLFQLINYLKARPAKSVRSIEIFLDTSGRTVYRYLDLLKDLGFNIEKDSNNKIFIIIVRDNFFKIKGGANHPFALYLFCELK